MISEFLEQYRTYDDTVLTYEEMLEKYKGRRVFILNVDRDEDGNIPPSPVYATCGIGVCEVANIVMEFRRAKVKFIHQRMIDEY